MTRRLLLVAGVPLLIGAAVALPVGLAFGPPQWGFAAIGFGLCVPPGLVTMVAGSYLIRTSPFGRVLVIFVGTIVRLVVGFGGGVVVFLLAGPEDRPDRIAFWLWVLFAYLTTLATETALLAGPVGGRRGDGAGKAGGGADHGSV